MSRKPGVLPTSFKAPPVLRFIAAPVMPPAWSFIVGTPIYEGENTYHGTCVATAAFNAAAVADMRKGIVRPIDNTLPFDLYCKLGGMPADQGLDPAVMFAEWQTNGIGGYRLAKIESIALDDAAGMKQSIIDNGFVLLTATLDQAQLTQKEFLTVANSPVDGDHMFLGTGYIADRLTIDSWGFDDSADFAFVRAQGINAWRCELAPI